MVNYHAIYTETVQLGSEEREGVNLEETALSAGKFQAEYAALVPKWESYRKQCPVLTPGQQRQNPQEWRA